MPYNSRANVVRLVAKRYDIKSNVKLGGFRSQLQASYVSSHAEVLWYNETVCLCRIIYIYWCKKDIWGKFEVSGNNRIFFTKAY